MNGERSAMQLDDIDALREHYQEILYDIAEDLRIIRDDESEYECPRHIETLTRLIHLAENEYEE